MQHNNRNTCCRRLFVELQSGPRFSADPKAFAQALNLDHTIQQVYTASSSIVLALRTRFLASNTVHALQDGQEFLKLLLSLLETRLAESGQPVRFVTCAFSQHKFVMHDLFGWLAVHFFWRVWFAQLLQPCGGLTHARHKRVT